MKRILIILLLLLAGLGVVYAVGLYPVARINGELLWYNDFSDRARALIRFDEKARAVSGDPALTSEERERSWQTVLGTMIGSHILRQYVASHPDFSSIPAEAENLVRAALQSADTDTLPRATEELYGWSVDEFREYVLYPQAFQNVLIKKVGESGLDLGQFITAELAAAHVQTFFVPWEWRDGGLRGKE